MKRNTVRAAATFGAAFLVVPAMAIGAMAPNVAGASTPTRILTCTGKVTSKPTSYVLSCADANAGWAGMAWSSWTSTSASGHGILHQNNCTPNCASGRFINYRATVTLSKVVTTKYGALFSRAVFHYSVSGKAKSETFFLAD